MPVLLQMLADPIELVVRLRRLRLGRLGREFTLAPCIDFDRAVLQQTVLLRREESHAQRGG